MTTINDNYLKLKAGYLFPEIGRRVKAFQDRNRNADIIRLGIGDVVLPLPPAVIAAMHEGVDFPTDVGTPVIVAAAGVVLSAERHPEYGNLLEIDHGNNLTTRYAHLSTILVKPGAVVRRGQKIGEVGNTGRSTGPHLHFEVRLHGQAQNPNQFLKSAASGESIKPKLAARR